MQPITPPLSPKDRGPQVVNLQNALQKLRGLLTAYEFPEQPTDGELKSLFDQLETERSDEFFGDATVSLVTYYQIQLGLGDYWKGLVEERTANKLNEILMDLGLIEKPVLAAEFVVEGYVRRPGADGKMGATVSGVTVQAFNQDVAKSTLLGQGVTDPDGSYRIKVTIEQRLQVNLMSAPPDLLASMLKSALPSLQSNMIRSGPQLWVGIPGEDGNYQAKSETTHNAISPLRIDLTLPEPAVERGPEFKRIHGLIFPQLEGLACESLTEKQIDFLSKSVEQPREHVAALASAARMNVAAKDMATRHRLDVGELESALFADFYAFLRAQPDLDLERLLNQGPTWWSDTFNEAIRQNRISKTVSNENDRLVELLGQLRALRTLEPAKEKTPASLGDLFNTLKGDWLTQDIRQKTARVIQEVPVESGEFMVRLKKIIPDETQRNEVRRTLRLGELTKQHAPMVAALQLVASETGDDSLRALSAVPTDRWLDLAYEHGAPADSKLSATDYALALEQRVEELHPTATLAARLKQQRFGAEISQADLVQKFLSANPHFDIVDSSIEIFLEQAGDIAVEEKTELQKALPPLQRMKRLSASWDETAKLKNAGIQSLPQVIETGPEGVAEALGQTERGMAIHKAATRARDAALVIMANATPRFNSIGIKSLPSAHNLDLSLLKDYPSVRALFGDLDTCACSSCLSVLSPAAYFVDLLQLLKGTGDQPHPAYQALMTRRPDLADIELSCENTETEVPQIDLSLEILENTVALPILRTFDPGTDVAALFGSLADNRNPIRAMLADIVQPLPEVIKASQEAPASKDAPEKFWIVTGDGARWTFRHREEGFVVGLDQVSGAEIAPLEFRVRGQHHTTWMAALDNRQAPSDLLTTLQERASIQDYRNDVFPFIGYEVNVVAPTRIWEMTFRRALRVKVRVDANPLASSVLTLETLDGDVILTRSLSYFEAPGVIDSLSHGRLGPRLSDYLPNLPFQAQYQIIGEQPAMRVWRIEASFRFRLQYFDADELTLLSLSHQSSHKAKHPLIEPEYHNPAAYGKLATAIFPWLLPFDLPFEETRRYFDYLGVSRNELRDQMSGLDPWHEVRLNRATLVQDFLGIAAAEQEIITDTAQGPGLWSRWGFSIDSSGFATVLDASVGEQRKGPPLELLRRVSVLLQQARLSFAEFEDVLQTRFVTHAHAKELRVAGHNHSVKVSLGGTSTVVSELNNRQIPTEVLGAMARFEPNAPADAEVTVNVLQASIHWQVVRRCHWTVTRDYETYTFESNRGSTPMDFESSDREELDMGQVPFNILTYLDGVGRTASVTTRQQGIGWDVTLEDKTEIRSIFPEMEILPKTGCKTSELRVPALNEPHLDRIHRFVRLMRRTGWSANELDLAIAAVERFGNGFGDTLRLVASLKRLQDHLSLDTEILAAWWLIDAAPAHRAHSVKGQPLVPGLYERIFLNPSTQNPPSRMFVLNSDRNELVMPGAPIQGDILRAVAAALGTRASEVEELLTLRAAQPVLLNFVNLIQLHAAVSLCRALGLSTSEYIYLRRLSGIDPFQAPSITWQFCDLAESVRDSGFTASELAYLLLHDEDASPAITLSRPRQAQILNALRGNLAALREELDKGFEARPHPENNADASQERTKFLQGERAELLRQRAISELVTATELDEATTKGLLSYYLVSRGSVTRTFAIERLISPDFLDSDPTKDPEREFFELLVRLHKAAIILTRLDLISPRLSWIAPAQTALALLTPAQSALARALLTLDFNTLPVTNSKTATTELFTGWRRLSALQHSRSSLNGAEGLIATYVKTLSSGTGWKDRVHQVLASGFDVKTADVASAASNHLSMNDESYRNPIAVNSLFKLLAAMRRLGATAEEAHELTAAKLTEDLASLARKLLHAKLGEAKAAEVIKQITDPLRIRQREALVDHLVHHESLRDPDQLYEYFLVDPQVSPKLKTTRILQATQSVQLFVQRCLLQQETDVTLTAPQRRRWKWMKNYRVWEANRKVFLYPENWLYPELREDKTASFAAVEGVLAQNEPNHDSAVMALLGYVRNVERISSVRVLGMYVFEEGGERKLYQIGRTPSDPGQYFWRTCFSFCQTGMHWSGWQPIELEVTGNHLVPFVLQGRAALAWPTYKKASTSNGDSWDITLNWSTQIESGWSRPYANMLDLTPRVIPGKDVDGMFTFRVGETLSPVSLISGLSQTKTPTIKCYVAAKPQQPPLLTPIGFSPDSNVPILTTVSATGNLRTPHVPISLHISVVATSKATKDIGRYAPLSGLDVYWSFLPPNAPANLINVWIPLLTTGSDGRGYRNIQILPPDNAQSQDMYLKAVTAKGEAYFAWIRVENVDKSQAFAIVGFNNFVEELPPEIPVDSDAQLSMKNLASVAFQSTEDSIVISGEGDEILPLDGTCGWGNGFRERMAFDADYSVRNYFRPDIESGKVRPVFAVTPGRFFATADLGPQRTLRTFWYGDDSAAYLYADTPASDSLPLLISEGARPTREVARVLADGLSETDLVKVQTITDNGRTLDTRRPNVMFAGSSIKTEAFHFDLRVPFAIYNWEMFFHVPWLLAEHLSRQQQFAEADRWLRRVFDPMTDEPPSADDPSTHYWKFLPFRRNGQPVQIQKLIEWLAKGKANEDLLHAVETWKDEPFRPHVIARTRIGAYQWRTVLSYIENLLAWGDQLFSRDTREAINEATQLYILASQVLGPRPKTINRPGNTKVETYRSLAGSWDKGISNAWIPLADRVANNQLLGSIGGFPGRKLSSENSSTGSTLATVPESSNDVLDSLGNLYFCVPPNEKMLELWDQVADRLFKIRYSLNIEGVARELALFDPPIDPELLVRATAAGLSIAEILAELGAPPPKYRFQVMQQKASELCAEVKSLGASLLAAMEKRDAEQLALLRAGHEVELLKLVQSVRQTQIEESQKNLDVLNQSRKTIEQRFTQLQILLARAEVQPPKKDEARPLETVSPQLVQSANLRDEERALGMIKSEADQLARMTEAQILGVISGGLSTAAGLFHGIAAIYSAALNNSAANGWTAAARFSEAAATAIKTSGEVSSGYAARDAILASYQRRRDEWKHQSNLAIKELEQIDKQIIAAELREAITKKELENTEKQIEQSSAVAEFLHSKFTNLQLYSWMESQIASVYFQAYRLAYDVAKRAERAFRFEIGDEKASFLKPGYWDSLKKGLLAGERLAQDLKRMDAAYLDRNRREFEITRHVSLRQLNPFALLQLRETGKSDFNVPEALFDLDFPGHYFRRIKSVSVTLPCVVGPYAGVNATLTLLSSKLREKNIIKEGTDYTDEENFRTSSLPTQSIATSTGQNDAGVFELNFRDERYLPFEGAGAISTWCLELPKEFKQFDYRTISDVVLHLRYTARDGGSPFKSSVEGGMHTLLNNMILEASRTGLFQAIDLRYQFPDQWALLKQGGDAQFTLGPEHLPFFVKDHTPRIDVITWVARVSRNPASYNITVNGSGLEFMRTDPNLENLCVGTSNANPSDALFTLKDNARKIEDLTALVHFTITRR